MRCIASSSFLALGAQYGAREAHALRTGRSLSLVDSMFSCSCLSIVSRLWGCGRWRAFRASRAIPIRWISCVVGADAAHRLVLTLPMLRIGLCSLHRCCASVRWGWRVLWGGSWGRSRGIGGSEFRVGCEFFRCAGRVHIWRARGDFGRCGEKFLRNDSDFRTKTYTGGGAWPCWEERLRARSRGEMSRMFVMRSFMRVIEVGFSHNRRYIYVQQLAR
jgi:hypothetical protein